MNFYGTLKHLVATVFRQNGQDITFQPNTSTTYTAARTFLMPPGDASDTMVGAAATQTLTNKTISGSSNTITNVSLTTGVTGTLPVANGGTNSATTLNNNRVMISSGGAIVEQSAITANKALASDANGLPVASSTTDTELGYVHGVTSAIQTQLNGKASTALDNLTVSGLTADDLLYASSSSALTRLPIGTNGQTLTVVSGAPAWATPAATTSNFDWPQKSSTVTISNASPAAVTYTAHGLVVGQSLYFTTTGTLPTGLSPNTIYYVQAVVDANTFNVAATYGGSAINTSSAGSGTHTAVVTSINCAHNFGTSDVMVQMYDKTDGSTFAPDNSYRTDTNNLLINSSEQPSSSGWRVMILKA